MKRGLVVRDRSEIADAEWDGRIEAVQSVMAEDGLDFVLVYGDVFRSDDIGYLTNLCIYWNEGVVAVPAQGQPLLLTKLSQRVHSWMRLTSTMTDLRSGKTFGSLAAGLVAEGTTGTLGLVDADLWPASIVDEIREAIPGWELRMLGSLVRDQRAFPSPAETALLRTGASILSRAVDTASAPGLSTTERIAALERDIRGGGFTDVAIQTDLTVDGILSLQVTGEYRHGWPHTSRLVAGEVQAPLLRILPAALAAAIRLVRPGVAWDSLVAAAKRELVGLPDDAIWQLRCVNQADMATSGELLSAGHHHRPPEPGEAVVLSLEVLHSGSDRTVVAETILVTPDGAELLTVSSNRTAP
ncbi:aminopeptidase P family N-terminal domain-containing protein [Homoserinimonas sp. A520]